MGLRLVHTDTLEASHHACAIGMEHDVIYRASFKILLCCSLHTPCSARQLNSHPSLEGYQYCVHLKAFWHHELRATHEIKAAYVWLLRSMQGAADNFATSGEVRW